MSKELRAIEIPRSATRFPLNVGGLLVGLLAIFVSLHLRPADVGDALLWGIGGIALTISVGEIALRRHERGAQPADFGKLNPGVAALQLLGLAVTITPIGIAYWLFPEYHGDFYGPYWQFLQVIALPVVCLAPLYALWMSRRPLSTDDVYLQLGRLCVGRGWGEIDSGALRTHCTAWIIKAFFLPLMVVYLYRELVTVRIAFDALSWETLNYYRFVYELSFLIDLLFCVVGYSLTLKALDSHIRSTEPTTLGWVAALVCYQPFYSVIGGNYLRYDDSGIFWDTWLSPYPVLRTAWGLSILFLTLTYAICTVAFGTRFSNLTHRGIITSGPYRFTKHPAYLSKNLSWWLVSVPFVSHAGFFEALRHCALLAGINLIYFLRARTEERHLSRDPVYTAYAMWIAQHGIWARLRRSIRAA